MKRVLSLLLVLLLLAAFPVMALAEEPAVNVETTEATETTETAESGVTITTTETAEPAETAAPEEKAVFPYVLDQYGLLTESQRSTLEDRAKEIALAHDSLVYIITVADHTQYAPDVYEAARGIFLYYELGYGYTKDGVLLLLSMNERDYALIGHGQMGEKICGYESSWIIEDAFLDNFKKNDWYGGFQDYLDACDSQLTKLENGEDITQGADIITGPDGLEYHSYNAPGASEGMPAGLKLVIGIGLPCLIALIVCMSFKSQMKSAQERTTAEEYVVPGGTELMVREDRFLNRTESRVRIDTDSGSSHRGGGGGSSFHSGGGFSGRSGKF